MSTVNIGGGKDDLFYRYKMPALQSKIEGRGNGIKTVIVNMSAIAQALERPPEYCTKYFGLELGALSKYSADIDKAVVNGAHENSVLVGILNAFIKKFVLCGQCGNPETVLACQRDDITLSCKACGRTTTVSPVERLCTFILKFPPDRLRKETETKGTRKGRRGGKNEGQSAVGRDIEGLEAEAVDATETNPLLRFRAFLADSARTKDEAEMELHNVQDLFELSAREMICLVFDAYLKTSANPLADTRDRVVPLVRTFVEQVNKQEPGAAAVIVLRYLQRLIKWNRQALLPVAPHVMKALYDGDVLEEEDILAWASKPTKKRTGRVLRDKVQPFIDWLRQAEEADEDEDDEEEDEEEDVEEDDEDEEEDEAGDDDVDDDAE